MGNNIQSIGFQYNTWNAGVSRGENTNTPFIVSNKDIDTDTHGFVGDFVELTNSYIGEYDKDGDGYISFEELYEKEVQIAQENGATIPDKETCRILFDKLNINNTDKSKDKLSQTEIFNYFFTLDSLNIDSFSFENKNVDLNNDGKITAAEYTFGTLSLIDNSKDPESIGQVFNKVLRNNYDRFFGE